ncbi:DUF1266 domain-containing protein [Gracilibacillus massiliensis]|uniref:DUF1266 domain-containing protein n=1 Tax=Gracilibacillus massiliensis TaxID=1564956 RepID=UPI00071D4B9D|nr:DUF1266 domain-containing protein [Gracilibacillus massiliensis]
MQLSKEFREFVSAIISFHYREDRFMLESLGLFPVRRSYSKQICDKCNIHNKADLDRELQWLYEEGERQEFNQLWHQLSLISYSKREVMLANMSDRNVDYLRQKMMHEKIYHIPTGGIMAIDIVNYLLLAVAGFRVKYLTEDQLHPYLIKGVSLLQQRYYSWQDFINGYALGQQFKAVNIEPTYVKKNKKYLVAFLLAKQSPMNRIDWDTPFEDLVSPKI